MCTALHIRGRDGLEKHEAFLYSDWTVDEVNGIGFESAVEMAKKGAQDGHHASA